MPVVSLQHQFSPSRLGMSCQNRQSSAAVVLHIVTPCDSGLIADIQYLTEVPTGSTMSPPPAYAPNRPEYYCDFYLFLDLRICRYKGVSQQL